MTTEAPRDPAPDEEAAGATEREQFVWSLTRLIQTARIHKASNRLVSEAVAQFLSSGRRLLDEDSVLAIEARHSRLFLQGEKLLFRRQSAVPILSMLGYLDRLGIYGLQFDTGFLEISREKAYQFACDILRALKAHQPLEWLEKRLDTQDYEWVKVLHSPQEGLSEFSAAEKAEIARQVYSYAYHAVQEVSDKVQNNRSIGIRKPLRVIQEIADLVFVDPSVLMAAMTIRDYDDYTFTHSVNVAIHSICLGHEIGLSRNSLVRLGICGLFHDLGKADIPREIINKPGPLDTKEFQAVKEHSLNSVRRLLRLKASTDLLAQMILPPLEHHLRYDLLGYPDIGWTQPISFFGRIIQICDVYDALTSSRIYRLSPFSPDRAIWMMLQESGGAFDPLLLKWFVNMHGVLPVGTVVGLYNGEVGIISDSGDLQEKRLPRVLLLEKSGGEYKKGKLIDLNQQQGNTDRRIKSTHHPFELGIQPFMYLSELW